MKYLIPLFMLILVGCMTTGTGEPNSEVPTLTRPVDTDLNGEARRTGNRFFGNIDNPSRVPGADELRLGLEPTIDCEHCAENAAAVERGDFGTDPGYTVSLKNYRNPAHGCISKEQVSSGEADRLLASQNLSVENAADDEKRALGAAIKRVQQLNGGVLQTGIGRMIRGGQVVPGRYPVRFTNDSGSGQRADHIKIGRNRSGANDHNHNGNSVAQHAHEWAHVIGNNGAYAQFKRYMDSSSYGSNDYCMVSNYADNNNNEQFAEVFTAFVTEPAILLNNSRTPRACQKAYQFFRDHFFNRGSRVSSCIPHPLANR
ncbi:MAG: hypothetical protein NXH75_09130 [Halobacteriovoraceae bacterium]|nr:hypothetical protein [Halobacteriovoraceae bacterium]